MFDFSSCEVSKSNTELRFKDLHVGETFAEIACMTDGKIFTEDQYVYIKTSDSKGLELNEERLDLLGEEFGSNTPVVRVKLIVSSLEII